jgi:hypothetical protein
VAPHWLRNATAISFELPLRNEAHSYTNRARRLLPPARRACRAKAITATARKLALLIYRVLSGAWSTTTPAQSTVIPNRARQLKSLRKRARFLGFELLDPCAGEVLPD